MTIAVDTETTGLGIHKGCRAFTISAATDDAKTYLWKFKVNPLTREVKYDKETISSFKETLAEHKTLVFHNGNFDIQVLDAAGVSTDYIFSNHDVHDTIVMSHAFKSDNKHGLKELGVTILGYPEDDEKRLSKITQAACTRAKKLGWRTASKDDLHESLEGTTKTPYKADYWVPEQLAEHLDYPEDHPWRSICDEYARKDAIRTIALYQVFQELLEKENLVEAYNKARKLILPILRMQEQRVSVIPEELDNAYRYYTDKCKEQRHKLYKIIGYEFNTKSPKQLRKAIYEDLGFTTDRRTKSGGLPTNKDVIVEFLQDCPTSGILPKKYRFLIELKKLRMNRTTRNYIKNYITHKDKNNLLKPTYKQTATKTNRLSAENPNTTNVSKRDSNNPFDGEKGTEHIAHLISQEDKFKLRRVFGPLEGEHWTAIDYQQFQLLIFAVVSESHSIIEAYKEGRDLHHATAVQIFGTDDISAVQRTAAKNVNFGILFGAGPAKIDLTAGINGLYSLFLRKFPKAKKYLDSQAKLARRYGYVHTVGGYRLYVPRKRTYAASCYVIQGTEAEIVRSAMCEIDNYTYRDRIQKPVPNYTPRNNGIISSTQRNNQPCPYRMNLMVHDEVILKSKEHNQYHLQNIMGIMEKEALKLGIPAKVDAEIITRNWGEKWTYEGSCNTCNGALVSWETEEYKFSDCIKCNPDNIGTIY